MSIIFLELYINMVEYIQGKYNAAKNEIKSREMKGIRDKPLFNFKENSDGILDGLLGGLEETFTTALGDFGRGYIRFQNRTWQEPCWGKYGLLGPQMRNFYYDGNESKIDLTTLKGEIDDRSYLDGFFMTLKKFLFCLVFKVFGFGSTQALLYLLYFFMVFLIVFTRAVFRILKIVFFTILGIFLSPYLITKVVWKKMRREGVEKKTAEMYATEEYIFDAMKYYLGLIFPAGMFGEDEDHYGRGEIGILVLVLILISSVIIIISGSSIFTVLVCFAIYCFNVVGIFMNNSGSGEGDSAQVEKS